jgi:hypothetical protein
MLLDTNEETFLFMLKMCYDGANCFLLIKTRQIFPLVIIPGFLNCKGDCFL